MAASIALLSRAARCAINPAVARHLRPGHERAFSRSVQAHLVKKVRKPVAAERSVAAMPVASIVHTAIDTRTLHTNKAA